MFNAHYFPAAFFAPRYFPEIGGVFTAPVPGSAKATVTGRNHSAKAEVTQ
jgi:hypothetical protein